MFMRRVRMVLVALATLGLAGLAVAQAEPTLKQIYAAAQAGQVDKARQMTQEVLRTHPNSAKAHFVLAELDASRGEVAQAREALATAESLAPGLPFAKPEAVQALRSRLSSTAALRSPRDVGAPAAVVARDPPPSPSFPWGMVLFAGGVVIVVAWVLRSRRASSPAAMPASPPAGMAPTPIGTGWGQQAGDSPQPGYGPQPAPAGQPAQSAQPAQSGMGGRMMGGLATGLAVGAGVMAAQEIGRRMLGDHPQQGPGSGANSPPGNAGANSQLANDAGLGSVGGPGGGSALPEDFGIADAGSWDDAGSSGGDDGGSWDN